MVKIIFLLLTVISTGCQVVRSGLRADLAAEDNFVNVYDVFNKWMDDNCVDKSVDCVFVTGYAYDPAFPEYKTEDSKANAISLRPWIFEVQVKQGQNLLTTLTGDDLEQINNTIIWGSKEIYSGGGYLLSVFGLNPFLGLQEAVNDYLVAKKNIGINLTNSGPIIDVSVPLGDKGKDRSFESTRRRYPQTSSNSYKKYRPIAWANNESGPAKVHRVGTEKKWPIYDPIVKAFGPKFYDQSKVSFTYNDKETYFEIKYSTKSNNPAASLLMLFRLPEDNLKSNQYIEEYKDTKPHISISGADLARNGFHVTEGRAQALPGEIISYYFELNESKNGVELVRVKEATEVVVPYDRSVHGKPPLYIMEIAGAFIPTYLSCVPQKNH